MTDRSDAITTLLQDWSGGDLEAAEEVLPKIYDRLRHIAASYFIHERLDHTLQPTAVVHEVLMRWQQRPTLIRDRGHFYALVARLMRQVLVDHARKHRRLKRGGDVEKVPLSALTALDPKTYDGMLALDHALSELRVDEPRQAAVVEMRFFGGLTHEDIAESLQVSKRTVIREWQRARTRLKARLASA
ncbi:MAG: ECF-type sigma factor [Acidobacteriota bacterium]